MSDTPETDRKQWGEMYTNKAGDIIYGLVVEADFARRLERERDKARATAKFWQEQYGHDVKSAGQAIFMGRSIGKTCAMKAAMDKALDSCKRIQPNKDHE